MGEEDVEDDEENGDEDSDREEEHDGEKREHKKGRKDCQPVDADLMSELIELDRQLAVACWQKMEKIGKEHDQDDDANDEEQDELDEQDEGERDGLGLLLSDKPLPSNFAEVEASPECQAAIDAVENKLGVHL